ncbi:transposase [Saccharopolyspora erythraea]|uniref:transposase n=1 Tax=Saccharopolyspora erythraea TaxID=1836 RepID=UPI0003256049|nr:transposase [Saccharopolyspora erythraea]QRK87422.1 IS110 family transposase [Saccharopolyspora erythraea]
MINSSHHHARPRSLCKDPLALARANTAPQRPERPSGLRLTYLSGIRRPALTADIDHLQDEFTSLVENRTPSLLAISGCGPLTAAKILGETAGADRFLSKDAYARHTGTAPLPVWSSNLARHRLSRTRNWQLNAELHRIALTQAHWQPEARATSPGAKPTATAGSRPSTSSNDDSLTSSTAP